MGRDIELHEAFKTLFTSEAQTFVAKVLAVNKADKTIKVEDQDGLDYDDVRLTSVIDSSQKVVQFPKVLTTVLVSQIGDDNNTLFVSASSEIESLEGTIGTTHFHIDEMGYTINRDSENLKNVLNDFITEFGNLCDELAKVVVSVGVSPNAPIINTIKAQATETIKNRLNTILK